MSDHFVSVPATEKWETSHCYKSEDIVTKCVEVLELPQRFDALTNETKAECDVKPCDTDLILSSSELPQHLRYESFPNEMIEREYNVKPCVTDSDVLIAPNSELLQRCEASPNEAEEAHCDVKPCVTDLLNEPKLPQTCTSCPTMTNVKQTSVKRRISVLSFSPTSELRQRHRYKEFPPERNDDPNDIKACNIDLSLTLNNESMPGHQTQHSPVPIFLIENKVPNSATCQTNTNQIMSVSKEDDTDRIAKWGTKKVGKSNTLKSVSADLYQSHTVSGNEDLENHFAGTGSNSLMQMTKHAEQGQFKCNCCGKHFKQDSHLILHMKTHTVENVFNCDRYSGIFSSKSSLDSRLGTLVGEKCNKCGKSFQKKSALKQHMKIHTVETSFQCGECGKSFHHKGAFHVHLRTHTGEKPFECNECGKSFHSKNSCLVHMRTHTGEKPFECNECGKSFHRKSSCIVHMRTHTGEKPFKCDECEKSFRDKSGFRVHMRTHKREKPFKCKECGKSFSEINYFHIHVRTHTWKEHFKCIECGKNFSESNGLLVHMRSHTGEKQFKCIECGKCFNHKSHFHVHLRTHTGEKPFKCNECGKRFNENTKLREHMRTHTGEKPFQCDECGKTFRHSNGLRVHKKTHTRVKSLKGQLQRQRKRRHFTPELSAPQKPLTQFEKRKVSQDRYRQNLREDPERYALYKAHDKEWQRQYRLSLPDDKKAVAREKARLRNIAYRRRQKEKRLQDKSSKPLTRLGTKDLEDRKERNRLSQQKRRSNMSEEKRRRERDVNLAYYHRKKASLTSNTVTPQDLQNELFGCQPKDGHTAPELITAEKPLSQNEKRRAIKEHFRRNIRADAKRHTLYKEHKKKRQCQHHISLPNSKKAIAREKTKLCNIGNRQCQKEKRLQDKAQKPLTRLDTKNLKDRKERNRLSQQKRRSNMSEDKKRQEREVNLAYYHRKKTLSASNTITPPDLQNELFACRPQKQHKCGLSTPEPSSPQKPLTQSEKKRVINNHFRRSLRADPERYALYKEHDKKWQRQYRLSLPDNKKAIAREKTRLRNIAYRKRQKEKRLQDKAQKPLTRIDTKNFEDCKERNKLSQQKRRSNMSEEKKRREREVNLAYYHGKKAFKPSDLTSS